MSKVIKKNWESTRNHWYYRTELEVVNKNKLHTCIIYQPAKWFEKNNSTVIYHDNFKRPYGADPLKDDRDE